MYFAISGTYQNGEIKLNEKPPIDEPCNVMVVFLSKPNKDFDYTKWQQNLFDDEDLQTFSQKAQDYYNSRYTTKKF